MVAPEEMYRLIKQEPFRPLRVHLDDGRVFEIRHPSLTLVSRQSFLIGIPDPERPDPRMKDAVLVGWSAVERVEEMDSTTPP